MEFIIKYIDQFINKKRDDDLIYAKYKLLSRKLNSLMRESELNVLPVTIGWFIFAKTLYLRPDSLDNEILFYSDRYNSRYDSRIFPEINQAILYLEKALS